MLSLVFHDFKIQISIIAGATLFSIETIPVRLPTDAQQSLGPEATFIPNLEGGSAVGKFLFHIRLFLPFIINIDSLLLASILLPPDLVLLCVLLCCAMCVYVGSFA